MARTKGSKNKVTRSARDVVLMTFEKLGGVDWLYAFAKNNPSDFVRLYGKLIPRNIVADVMEHRRYDVRQKIIDGEQIFEQRALFQDAVTIEGCVNAN